MCYNTAFFLRIWTCWVLLIITVILFTFLVFQLDKKKYNLKIATDKWGWAKENARKTGHSLTRMVPV